MTSAEGLRRRTLLAGAAGAPLLGCARAVHYDGGWIGAAHERGHRLRDANAASAPALQRRAGVIVVGAGIAGLAAARALMRAGIDDVHLFELEDTAGGNSRGHVMGGMACPRGAHYLPLPGASAVEVAELLDEFGLRRTEHGRAVYDERHLCHSPQERLFIDGQWVEGLLPPIDALPAAERATTLAQYRRFSAVVSEVGKRAAFSVPTARAPWSPALAELDAVRFSEWLDAQGFTAPALRWTLDYCCRDDYGAGAGFVSAWAGLHYFASRHGFHAPGNDAEERDAVLTWPEGNAWLSMRLAAPLGDRLHTGMLAERVREGRHDASVDLWNVAAQRGERWSANRIILAVPLFVAARLLETPPDALRQASAQQFHAPWLVANLQLGEPLLDRGGAAPAWDNVIYAGATLGYVDAMHQSTRAFPGPTVLSAYWALAGDTPQTLVTQRARLLDLPWSAWSDAVISEMARAHPDLRAKLRRVDLMRYGHAMSIPAPGVRGSAALRSLAQTGGRVHLAHSDLAGYSVFEEALYFGQRAGRQAARALRGT
jgi:predicted NAD/FAD-dependent oxidoreductase